ncbi:DUF732 domain-containing protein [Mycobacterium sp. 94-17]|uniref:DUF732 domain-containing protein n=1 Tax=Mycobacterium sp. 94-17 TaxID=2986147 RepID=UPI002D1EF72B|nr:DUF732 domain-containing protein [Mycobacterium sp. 94-17]MEB4208760.1 DUF732 domain-containing protein [Mycobacterium sp. 94-17]
MKRLYAAAAVLAALVAAPAAHADADGDFLAAMHEYGINFKGGDDASLKLGRAVCKDLRDGASSAAESAAVFRILPDTTEKQSGNIVSAAQIHLCPDTIGQ